MLPAWNNSLGGAISFKFRTNEPTGLLLFNRGTTPGNVNWICVTIPHLDCKGCSSNYLDGFCAKKLNFEKVLRFTLRWKSMIPLNDRPKNQILLSKPAILIKVTSRKTFVILKKMKFI